MSNTKTKLKKKKNPDPEEGDDGQEQLLVGYLGYIAGGKTVLEIIKPLLRRRGSSLCELATSLGFTRQNLTAQLGQERLKIKTLSLVIGHLDLQMSDFFVTEMTLTESKDL